MRFLLIRRIMQNGAAVLGGVFVLASGAGAWPQEAWLNTYRTCQNAVERLHLGRSLTDVFWGSEEREYLEAWGEHPVVLTLDKTLWIVARSNGFAVIAMPRFKVRPKNVPALYVITHLDPQSKLNLYELWSADVTKATAAGLPVSAFPETTLLPLPASRLRDDFRRLLISEIGNAKVGAREDAISDPKSVPAEDFGREMTACEKDMDQKDDSDLLHQIRSKLKSRHSSGPPR
jgi:hypothetical protein